MKTSTISCAVVSFQKAQVTAWRYFRYSWNRLSGKCQCIQSYFTPVEFNNLNPTYSFIVCTVFGTAFIYIAQQYNNRCFFQCSRLLNIYCLTRGFGSVFSDVDLKAITSIQYFDQSNVSLGTYLVPEVATSNETLSFLGISYDNPTILRLRITSGNTPMGVSETFIAKSSSRG